MMWTLHKDVSGNDRDFGQQPYSTSLLSDIIMQLLQTPTTPGQLSNHPGLPSLEHSMGPTVLHRIPANDVLDFNRQEGWLPPTKRASAAKIN